MSRPQSICLFNGFALAVLVSLLALLPSSSAVKADTCVLDWVAGYDRPNGERGRGEYLTTWYEECGTVETPVGSPVTVHPCGSTVVFSAVSIAGTTSVTVSRDNPSHTMPGGFRVQGQFMNITTTVTYQAPVIVGISYDPDTPNPQNLRLFHWLGSRWVDVTTSVDTDNHIVWGVAERLSWWFVGGPSVSAGEQFDRLIATAAYGSPLAEEVVTLRAYRDRYLLTNPVGSWLVSLYYRYGPPVGEFVDENPALKPVVKVALLPPLALANVSVHTNTAHKAAISVSIILIGVSTGLILVRRNNAVTEDA